MRENNIYDNTAVFCDKYHSDYITKLLAHYPDDNIPSLSAGKIERLKNVSADCANGKQIDAYCKTFATALAAPSKKTAVISSYISGITLMIAGFFILLNKKFKKHPYPLIGLALLFEASYFFSRYG